MDILPQRSLLLTLIWHIATGKSISDVKRELRQALMTNGVIKVTEEYADF